MVTDNSKVLARRVSSCPMDTHFWKKYKETSLNLLDFYGKTCLLDSQFQCLAESLENRKWFHCFTCIIVLKNKTGPLFSFGIQLMQRHIFDL